MAFYDDYLKDDEDLVRVVRSYPIVYLPRLARALVVLLLPFFLIVPLFQLQALGFFIFGVLVTVGLLLLIRTIAIAYFKSLLVTSHRVIDWDQRGLFDRIISEALHENVRDISHHVKGALGTMLDYGTLQIQTAGAVVTLRIKNVRHPQDIQSLIKDIKVLRLDEQVHKGLTRADDEF